MSPKELHAPLTCTERRLLRIIRRAASPEAASIRAGLPLAEVEAELRRMAADSLVTRDSGAWRATSRGAALARETRPVDPIC